MRLTSSDLDRLSGASAAALRAAGVREGDRVALRGAQTPAYVAALVGVWRLGAVAIPLAPRASAPVAADLVAVGAGWLVTDEAGLSPGGARRLGVPRPDAAPSGMPVPPLAGVPDAAPAVLVLTSGSTGAPKAALLTHGALRASARGVAGALGFGPGAAWALALPLHHVGGLGVLVRALEAGGGIVVPAPGAPLAEVLAHPATSHASLVATQLHRVLRDAPDVLVGKTILLGGSALPPALLDAAHARRLAVCTSYGLTEMASAVTATVPGAPRAALTTSGRLLPERELRVSPAGEIEGRGLTRFAGYATADELLTPFDADGWYATGDLGGFDATGQLVVTGRRDLMFVSGGENVQPEAVERALVALPGVREAVVVPVADAEFGHRAFAFVGADGAGSGADGAGTPDAARIRAALREMLPPHLVPVAVAWLPDAGGLKPSRRALADVAERLRAAPPTP